MRKTWGISSKQLHFVILFMVGLILSMAVGNGNAAEPYIDLWDDTNTSDWSLKPDLVTSDFILINVKDFGAMGDGHTDDSVTIQEAVNKGDIIYFPSGSYLVSSTIIVDHRVHLIGGGTLVVDDESHLDKVVDIQATADGTTITGLTVDQSYVTMNIGDGFGIYINADYCHLQNVTVIGQGDVFDENTKDEACFEIHGDHCILFGCVAREASYAGFRCKGSKNTKIIGCESLEWRYKGFAVNGSASNIIIDSCIARTQSGASAGTAGILIDSGNHNMGTIILSNIVVSGDYNGTGVKIAPKTGFVVENAHIRNLSIKATNLEKGLTLNSITNCYATNIYVTQKITVGRYVKFCQINGLASDVAGANDQNIDARLDGTLMIESAYLKGAITSGIRLDDSSGHGQQVVFVDKVTLVGNDENTRMFRFVDEPWPGRIKLGSFDVVIGQQI
jgi:hypothetical protein